MHCGSKVAGYAHGVQVVPKLVEGLSLLRHQLACVLHGAMHHRASTAVRALHTDTPQPHQSNTGEAARPRRRCYGMNRHAQQWNGRSLGKSLAGSSTGLG